MNTTSKLADKFKIMPMMKFNLFHILLVLSYWSIFPSCYQTKEHNRLQEGDLLFQNLNCGELCDAIESVTHGVDGKDFSHCAMVVKINDSLKVVEAIGDKVQANSLEAFFARSGDTSSLTNITVGRVKNNFEAFILKATEFAKKQIGQPYDDDFLMDNGKWYCSELLYQSFKEANNNQNFFELEPMTFKDPKTNQFFPAWIEYYKQSNTNIPEGKLGINPGLISRSKNIQIIDVNNYKQ
jgi:hypothetical protein